MHPRRAENRGERNRGEGHGGRLLQPFCRLLKERSGRGARGCAFRRSRAKGQVGNSRCSRGLQAVGEQSDQVSARDRCRGGENCATAGGGLRSGGGLSPLCIKNVYRDAEYAVRRGPKPFGNSMHVVWRRLCIVPPESKVSRI